MQRVFEVGDKIEKTHSPCQSAYPGEIYIVRIDPKDESRLGVGRDDNKLCGCQEEWKLISKNKGIIMDLKEKFLLALTAEPQKSFRKAGITNGDDLLTEEGKDIFMSWLLRKNQDLFKTEVVDDLLKEEPKK